MVRSTTTRAPRSTTTRNKVKSAADTTTTLAAPPVKVEAPPVLPTLPAAPPSLATLKGEEQSAAIIEALKGAHLKVAAAALAETSGKVETAAALVGAAVLPTLHLVARIIPILRNTAPAALFNDGNNRGARVGELFASRLGLSALYRDTTRADLKGARAALVESAK